MENIIYNRILSKFCSTKRNRTCLHKSFHKIVDNAKKSLRENSSMIEEHMKMSSIHSAQITEIHEVPVEVIIRPLVASLDEAKVKSLIETLKNPKQAKNIPPIDVLWVKGREGGNYYFSFGGCHRYEAFKRLKCVTIPCKIIKTTAEDIKIYMGSSMPDLK